MPDGGAASGANMSGLWNLSPASPTTPAVPSPGFANLPPVGDAISMADEELLQNLGAAGYSGAPLSPDGMVPQYPGGAVGFDNKPVTMMQRLLADRRKRLIDYQQKLIKGILAFFPGLDMES